MALAGNGRWCYLDPKLGAMHAVAEAARKVACTGATPVAATNCLNFGNPEKPEIMAQLSAAIDGIAEACRALDVPITGGNVSLYNETKGEGIYPTPVVGVVGLLDDVSKAVPSGFQREGDAIAVILPYDPWAYNEESPAFLDAFGSSAFTASVLDGIWGRPPEVRPEYDKRIMEAIAELARFGLLRSASDISDGGIACALAKASFPSGIGFRVEKVPIPSGVVGKLFYESASGYVLSFAQENKSAVEDVMKRHKVSGFEVIGRTQARWAEYRDAETALISATVSELRAAYASTLESQLAAEVVTA